MGIPSYTDNTTEGYDDGEFLEYIAGIAQISGLSYQSVKDAILELRDVISTGLVTVSINSDGKIDLSKVNTPNLVMLRSTEIEMYGNPDDKPIYFGWERGHRVLIFGEGAIPYIQAASLPGQSELIVPNLVLLGTDGIITGTIDGAGIGTFTSMTVNFGATFMTVYGETQMSNVITVGPVMSWQSVTLGVVTEDIPTYATSVRYYRTFDDVFRRVLEVKL